PAETLRYRFELIDETGLENPDPGLFAIHVAEDRRPVVEILAPGRAEVETVVGGVLPLRVRAADDFGIDSMKWTSVAVNAEPAAYPLEFAPVDAGENSGFAVLAAARLTGDLLSGDGPVAEGQQFQLTVAANDNRAPESQQGESVELRVRVVSSDEFMRRLQDRLARARLSAGELTDLQRDKWDRTRELLAALDSDEIEFGPDSAGIAGALTGQRRVLGDAGALTRELASITEALIYSSIDERSGTLLEALDTSLSSHADKSFHVESWRSLAQVAQRDPSVASGLAGRLVGVIQLSLEVSEESGALAAQELVNAQESEGALEEAKRALTAASNAQERSLQKLEELIERLAEWDNFQSVLALTRDILNRQKNLLERTKSFAKEQ
ncbi:MAG: hypothetical protein AAF368_07540, partial [Planctomycetota bacterium]